MDPGVAAVVVAARRDRSLWTLPGEEVALGRTEEEPREAVIEPAPLQVVEDVRPVGACFLAPSLCDAYTP